MPITIAAVFLLTLPAAAPTAAPDQLSQTLRTLLLQHLPAPLYQSQKDWGKTKDVKVFTFRHGKPVVERSPRNDGLWREVRIDAINPHQTLVLEVRDFASPKPGVITFTLHIAGDVQFEADQQQWESGIKMYGASIRARARVSATLHCEVTTKTEFKNLLPDIVCQAKVLKSDVGYDNLHVEHVAGLGGDFAKVVGVAGHEMIHQWKPSIERHLLAKANEAMVKAVEKKEVRIRLAKLAK
ncbi:MAG: hypothetical protein ACJ8C4_04545 [Gemmataceae bacterium]